MESIHMVKKMEESFLVQGVPGTEVTQPKELHWPIVINPTIVIDWIQEERMVYPCHVVPKP